MSIGAVGDTAARPPGVERDRWVHAGIRVEVTTLIWMTVEAAVGIGAGVVARSVLLTAFGLDSVIELVTGAALLWRLTAEARDSSLERIEQAERRAAWIAGIGLALLCAYVLILSALGLFTRTRPDASLVGIGLAVVALLGMPILARRKLRIAEAIGSASLRGDAACSITCAYMAGALLLGLAARALLGWWWADGVAALALLYWLVPETREALDGARAGKAACSCAEDDCAE